MGLSTQIVDSTSNGFGVAVTSNNQLVTGNVAFDNTMFVELAEPDIGYNFYKPVENKQFVITGIIAKADKQVSSTVDADVIVYEAPSSTSTTTSKVLFQMAMVEGDLAVILPLNIVVNTGVWINAMTTDDDIHITITGYWINRI